MKRKLVFAAGFAVLLCLGLTAFICYGRKTSGIFTMDDTVITSDQFSYYITKNRAAVINQYQTEAEAIEPDFWEKTVEGKMTVADKLKETAKDDCLREQMIFTLAEKKGLTDKATFTERKEQMNRENQARTQAIEDGKVVYGNENYNIMTYINYQISNLKRELIQNMEHKELKFTDEELLHFCREQGKEPKETEDIQEIRRVYAFAYKDYLFEQYVNKLIAKSTTSVNEKAYDAIKVE